MTIKITITNDDTRGENAIVEVKNINPDFSPKDLDPRTNYANRVELKGGEKAIVWVSSDSSVVVNEVKNG